MKRTLTLILVALLLIGTLFVSCSDEASDTAGTDKLVTVSISGTSTSKAMTATLESVVPGYDELVWFYQATKNDNGLYATGQTSGWTLLKAKVEDAYVEGLSDTRIGKFSTGDWIFQFKGVENDGNIGTANESVIYECTSLEAEVSSTTATGQTEEENDTVYLIIPLTAGSGVDTATVKFGSLTFTLPSSDSFNANAATNYYVTITEGDTVLYTSTDAVSGTTAGQTITFDLSSATLSNNTYISSGSHTYTFTVVLKDDSGDEVATVGGYEYTISINTGVTATVSGAIDSTDTVYYVVVGKITGATQTASVSDVTATADTATTIETTVTPASVSEGTSTTKNTTVTFAANELDASTTEEDTTYSYTLDMTVYGVESASTTFSVSSSDSSAVAGLDLSLTKTTTTGSNSTNTSVTSFDSPVTISTYLATGLEDVSVVYNGDGDAPSNISYTKETGLLTFTTTHFSEFYVQASNEAINATANIAYRSIQDALEGATKNSTILVLKDIALGEQTSTPLETIDETFTLDLNGHVVSASVNGTEVRVLVNKGTMTLKDSSTGTLGAISNISTGTNDCTRTIENAEGASLTVNSAKILSSNGQAIINFGDIVLNSGAVLKSTGAYSGNYSNGAVLIDHRTGSLTIHDGATLTTDAGTALYVFSGTEVTIDGGDFTCNTNRGLFGGAGANDIEVTGGTYNYDPSLFAAFGYDVEEDSGIYTVTAGNTNYYDVDTVDELKTALAAASSDAIAVVTVTGNMSLTESVTISEYAKIIVDEGKTLTIGDSGVLINDSVIDNYGTIAITGTGFLSYPLNINGDGNLTNERFTEITQNGTNYSITNPMDLQWLTVVNSGNTIYSLNVTLENDIEMPVGVEFQQIPKFRGVFDGKGHTISNVVIDSASDYAGLFRCISNTTVKDLTLSETITFQAGTVGGIAGFINEETYFENVTVNGTITVAGYAYGAGGYVGNVYGTDADSKIHFVGCTNNADVYAPNGSIVGGFYGTATGNKSPMYVINCTNTGDITSSVYAASVGGFKSYESTGVTYVYNHSNTGTLTSGSNTVNTVLGADGYGTIVTDPTTNAYINAIVNTN